MDDHQRRIWMQMIDAIDAFDAGALDLGTLCSHLQGLLGASDLRDTSLIDGFWDHFLPIDSEHELRTEDWAPQGLASDDALRAALDQYKAWVRHVLATTNDART